MAYDNSNSGILGKNDRMRDGKKDPEYNGSCDIVCPCCKCSFQMWISAWVNVSGPQSKTPGRKFFGLKFKPKDDPGAAPSSQPSNRVPSQPSAPPRTGAAVPIGDPNSPSGFNPPSDPDSETVPF